MPKLKCSVQTCAHNHQFLCDLDQIQVGGNQACSPSETQCDSFTERKEGGYSNAAGGGCHCSETTGIDCQAEKCMYNEACKCQAGRISVEGGQAKQCQGTECATFKM